MIGEDIRSSGKRNAGNWLFLILVVAKAIKSSTLSSVFLLLRQIPVALYVFLVCAGSSVFFLALQRPWTGRKQINGSQLLRIAFYSFVMILTSLLWNFGLKYYGPVRTILSSDHADLTFFYIVGALLNYKSIAANKVQGAAIITAAYLLLFWFGTTPSAGAYVDPPGSHFYIGPIPIEEGKLGGICVFIAVALTMFRKTIAKRFYGDIGGSKRLFSISMTIAAIMLLPVAIYQIFAYDVHFTGAMMATVFGAIIFIVVVDYYVDIITTAQLDVSTTATIGLSVSFVSAVFAMNFQSGFLDWISFAMIAAGMYLLLSKSSDGSALPVYGTNYTGSSGGYGDREKDRQSIWLTFSQTITAIVSKRDSRNIFLFLLVNLAFMFVEMAYGFWTNSLGLVTDAFHMLFDCMALFIALFAEVISMWEANQTFSYGYGRVQVLSGFCNGVFLIFIAFFVMMESVERFMEPPEVKTDKLLLVSVLGFCVNLVGMFSFHDHGHGHGGHEGHDDHEEHDGHSHSHKKKSHDHDHGHSHEHKHEKKDKPKKSHSDHGGHSHSHGRSENIHGVFLHLLADTLGSVGVIISSLLIQFFGWNIADPIFSGLIAALIFASTIPLLQSSSKVLLQCTPTYFVPILDETLAKIRSMEGVQGFRDPHFWSQGNDYIIGTVHLMVAEDVDEQRILNQVIKMFKEQGVSVVTVEIEKVASSTQNLLH